MLHVTNGDATLPGLARTGLPGEMLPWRDVLHDGPVPALAPAELRAVRARFIASRGWAPEAKAEADLRERDERLEAALGREPVILWFEHDLYDQLQLLQVLDRLPPEEAGQVELIQARMFLGALAAEELADLWPQRRSVSAQQVASARAAWAAFQGDDPRELARLASEGGDRLPYLRAALWRLLEELPGVGDGLARTESQLLEAIAGGAGTRLDAFTASQAREKAAFLGDASAFARLDDLAGGSRPLIELAGVRLALTQDGAAVLAGTADRVALTGLDRWIGGVHLRSGAALWRWDPERREPLLLEGAA